MTAGVNSKVTIIISAKNEEETIGDVLDEILLNFTADDIVVIVGKTIDHTVEIAKQKNIEGIHG